jgi:hypothetical protein
LAPSSNAHTYRLLIVKELIPYCLAALANRFVRQQHRDEIMQCFAIFVNLFFATPQITAVPGGTSTT